jgi:peptidoglycan hydrolase-like protein with peptidoglycan-binding domain
MTGATSTGGSANAQMSAPQSIDPSQIQKVFGTDATLIDLKSLNTEDVRQLQQTLQQRGHYRGELDGVVGPQTRAALRAVLAEQFALNQKLINQGQLTEQVASSVGIDAQGVSPVRGIDMGSTGTPSPSGQQRPSGTMGSSPSPSGSPHPTTPSDTMGSSPQSGSVTPTTPPPVEEEE